MAKFFKIVLIINFVLTSTGYGRPANRSEFTYKFNRGVDQSTLTIYSYPKKFREVRKYDRQGKLVFLRSRLGEREIEYFNQQIIYKKYRAKSVVEYNFRYRQGKYRLAYVESAPIPKFYNGGREDNDPNCNNNNTLKPPDPLPVGDNGCSAWQQNLNMAKTAVTDSSVASCLQAKGYGAIDDLQSLTESVRCDNQSAKSFFTSKDEAAPGEANPNIDKIVLGRDFGSASALEASKILFHEILHKTNEQFSKVNFCGMTKEQGTQEVEREISMATDCCIAQDQNRCNEWKAAHDESSKKLDRLQVEIRSKFENLKRDGPYVGVDIIFNSPAQALDSEKINLYTNYLSHMTEFKASIDSAVCTVNQSESQGPNSAMFGAAKKNDATSTDFANSLGDTSSTSKSEMGQMIALSGCKSKIMDLVPKECAPMVGSCPARGLKCGSEFAPITVAKPNYMEDLLNGGLSSNKGTDSGSATPVPQGTFMGGYGNYVPSNEDVARTDRAPTEKALSTNPGRGTVVPPTVTPKAVSIPVEVQDLPALSQTSSQSSLYLAQQSQQLEAAVSKAVSALPDDSSVASDANSLLNPSGPSPFDSIADSFKADGSFKVSDKVGETIALKPWWDMDSTAASPWLSSLFGAPALAAASIKASVNAATTAAPAAAATNAVGWNNTTGTVPAALTTSGGAPNAISNNTNGQNSFQTSGVPLDRSPSSTTDGGRDLGTNGPDGSPVPDQAKAPVDSVKVTSDSVRAPVDSPKVVKAASNSGAAMRLAAGNTDTDNSTQTEASDEPTLQTAPIYVLNGLTRETKNDPRSMFARLKALNSELKQKGFRVEYAGETYGEKNPGKAQLNLIWQNGHFVCPSGQNSSPLCKVRPDSNNTK